MLGSDGVCATACDTARLPAAAAAPWLRNLRRFMDSPFLKIAGSLLGLGPGKSRFSPAADGVAVLLRVLVALESFQDVVGLLPACTGGGFGGAVRAGAP